jgi:hypothetical protein
LVVLARTAWQTLSQLLLLGADAPLPQQQLALLQQQHQQLQDQEAAAAAASKKRSKQPQQQHPANGAAAAGDVGLRHLEAQALGMSWRLLGVPVVSGFDALILLRHEALPFAERADPLVLQELQLLVSRQHKQQRRLAGGSKKQQQQGVLKVLLGGAGAAAGGDVRCGAPKEARAILRDIPEQVGPGQHHWWITEGVVNQACWVDGACRSWVFVQALPRKRLR